MTRPHGCKKDNCPYLRHEAFCGHPNVAGDTCPLTYCEIQAPDETVLCAAPFQVQCPFRILKK